VSAKGTFLTYKKKEGGEVKKLPDFLEGNEIATHSVGGKMIRGSGRSKSKEVPRRTEQLEYLLNYYEEGTPAHDRKKRRKGRGRSTLGLSSV